MKKLIFIAAFLFVPLLTTAQTPSRSGITLETKEASLGQAAVNLEGYLSAYNIALAQGDAIQVWFRVRKKGDTAWGATGGSIKQGNFSPTFTYAYTGVFTGIGCEQLEYQAVAQYRSVLRSIYQSPPEYRADIGTFDLTVISNRSNAQVALGEMKLLQGTGNCEDPGPSTTGGEDEVEDLGNNTYVFLTPLPLNEGLQPKDSVEIGAGGGGILGILQRIFTIMLVAAVVLAVVFMIIGGARYATGDTLGSKMGGKEIITNAVKGLLFALLAWLLLNIVNPDLLRFTLSIPNIGQPLTLGTGNATPTTGVGSTIPGEGCSVGVTDEECFAKIIADEPRVRGQLSSAGITIERGDIPCQRFNAAACTTVGLLSNTTLNKLIQVNTDCKQANQLCKTIITGATEYWLHGTGGNHKKFTAVDLKLNNAPFDNFIKSKEKVANPYRICRETYSYKGLRFCNESGSHWHVETLSSTGGGTGSGNTGDPKPGKLFTFPRINIQGFVVPGTGSVYNTAQITGKLNVKTMTDLGPKILVAANRESLNYKLFYALIAQESAGNPQAGSGAGACGVAQLLPNTAQLLDPSLTGDICQKLKNDVDLSLRLGAKYLKQGGGSDMDKLARYNGGPEALEASSDCPGRKKYECPWDAPGYYDRSKPNGAPLKALEKQSDINTGYSETRFYIINILTMMEVMR